MKKWSVILIALLIFTATVFPAAAGAYPLTYAPGTDETVSGIPEDVYVTGGELFTIPETAPQREGYEFVQWNISFEALQQLLTSLTVRNTDYLTGLSLSGKLLEDLEVWSEVTVGADEIEGYYLMNDAEQTRVVVEDPEQNEITFLYAPEIPVSYEVRFEADDSGEPLSDPEVYEDGIAGTTVKLTAPEFDGYTLEGETEQSLTLNTDAEGNVLTFRYIRQLADVEIRFVNEDDEDLALPLEFEDLPAGKPVEFEFPVIEGYELDGEEEDFELIPAEGKNRFAIPFRPGQAQAAQSDPEISAEE